METKTTKRMQLAGLIPLACNAAVASAQVTEYTDQGSYNAATSGQQNYDFNGIAPGLGDVSRGGVNFSAGNGGFDYIRRRHWAGRLPHVILFGGVG